MHLLTNASACVRAKLPSNLSTACQLCQVSHKLVVINWSVINSKLQVNSCKYW